MKKIKVLQVEYIRDNSYRPNFSYPNINYVDLFPNGATIFPNYSNHATDVAQRLAGPNSPAYNMIDTLGVDEAASYYSKDGLGAGRENYDPANPIYPKSIGFAVENHSWGGSSLLYDDQILSRLNDRILRDNVVVCIAVPDKGMGYGTAYNVKYPFRLLSVNENAINVGSGTGYVDILPGSRVDIVTGEQYTSNGCPIVAAACVVLINEFLNANVVYKFSDIKKFILDGADAMADTITYGRGKLNLNKSLQLVRDYIKSLSAPVVTVPVVTTPPITIPTPVVTTPSQNMPKIISVTCRGQNLPNEGIKNLTDGSSATKWLDFALNTWFNIKYDAQAVLSDFTLTSANDSPLRDPANIKLYTVISGVKTLIQEWKNITWNSARFVDKVFTLTQPAKADEFYFELVSNPGQQYGNITQLAEFKATVSIPVVIPDPIIIPPPVVIVPPVIVPHTDTQRLDWAISKGFISGRAYIDQQIG